MTRARLFREMDPDEFEWWRAIYTVEPFDDRRCHDLPAALIRADARAIAGDKKADPMRLMPFSGRKALSPSDLFADFAAEG